ncbi:MAG: DUF3021 family protein [Tannerella sp.]|jgi:amino acid transporter|nr:DUF3021 family protein [Tannerella sp.]
MKEFVKELFDTFFIIFTCSILGLGVYMYLLGANFAFLRDIAAIFVISILTTLTGFIFYTKREPKRREMFIRHTLHLIAIMIIALIAASYLEWILWSVPITVIRFMGLIIGIWVSAHIIIFYQSKKLADDLNRKLKERYRG